MSAPPPRTIVHVPRRFVAHEWGGTETVILEISRQQRAAGKNPVVVTSMALSDRRDEEIGGIPVRRFPHTYPFFGLSDADRAALDRKGGNLLSLPLLRGLLREPDVRLYHAHALKRLGGTVRTAARLRGKPYVVSLHGGVFDVPAAELADLTRPIGGKFEWGRVFGALLGARRVLEEADHVVCVGEEESRRARATLPHDRVSYLPNGVDTARFTRGDGARFRQAHGIPPGAFVVLSIGRIDAQKNQLGLLQAFAILRAGAPDAMLVLAGPETQPAYAASLRAFVRDHGLGDAVRLLPPLANGGGDLVDAYHAANAFALASRHEPFGIVVLEAWCAGLPVVASHVGGLRALVREGETGLFFDPDAPDAASALAERLGALRANPALRRALGDAGRAEALARYDWSRVSAALEDIYLRAEAHHAARKGGAR